MTIASQTEKKQASYKSQSLPLTCNTIYQALNSNPSKRIYFEKTLQQLENLKNMFQAY
jgi:hypothetical protein